uniref:Uncharacterized protein n=1 Tax=Ascaris lumbricoides TaxID=6252 RepID=A0A0M3ILS1_ASCLU
MISRCFRTICRDWMHECHWFCDSTRTKVSTKDVSNVLAGEDDIVSNVLICKRISQLYNIVLYNIVEELFIY